MSILGELKRRNVFKVAVAYTVMAWLLLQIADILFETFHAPEWVTQVLTILLALGMVPVVVFSWVYEITPDGIKRESQIDRSRSITATTGQRLDYAIIGLLIVSTLYFFWESRYRDNISLSQPQLVTDQGTVIPVAQAALETEDVAWLPPEKSIAVLPFVNLSGDPEQEYFSDGISEELLNVLSKLPQLHVVARTSSFQFKGDNRDITEIAHALRVRHILEGSVRRSGNRVRITAQLIDATSGYHEWSENYDRELADIFEIQDEISSAIVESLRVELALRGTTGFSPRGIRSSDFRAYDAYLLASAQASRDPRAALDYLERSLSLDPEFAPAHALTAHLLVVIAGTAADADRQALLEKAAAHTKTAQLINPGLASAHLADAMRAEALGNPEMALAAAERALIARPGYAEALVFKQQLLENSQKIDESRDVGVRLARLDPLGAAVE
jgi:TolB-like protein